jgi:sodium/hydrogen exchanger-like protein 6/7
MAENDTAETCPFRSITTLYNIVDNSSNLTSNISRKAQTLYFPLPKLEVKDEITEEQHVRDGIVLIIIIFLLFITIITIWIFKAKRIRVCHETGLAMIYGIIVGVIVRYAIPSKEITSFAVSIPRTYSPDEATTIHTKCQEIQRSLSTSTGLAEEDKISFAIGETVALREVPNVHEGEGGDTLFCAISGKSFAKEQEAVFQRSLVFDPEIFFFVILPPIIFQAGYRIKKRHFFRNVGSLMTYAFAGTTISCFIVGLLMWGYTLSPINEGMLNDDWKNLLNGFSGSVVFSLLFGALISATDPVTVLAVFHDLHADYDLYSLVFGESVMNDAVAIVLFGSIDAYNPEGGSSGSTFDPGLFFASIAKFFGIFIGSFLLGILMGLITALVLKMSKLRDYPLLETTMFVVMSYATFVIAETAQLTGIVAILFCGMMQSHYTYINMSNESKQKTKDFFDLLNFVAENFVFVYMGLSLFSFAHHQWLFGFILFSFVAIFIARVINVYCLSFLLNLGRKKKISFRFQHMLVFAGLRGAIAFALAIRNTSTPNRQLIFTCTLVIVIVTILVNGGFSTLALQFLKIKINVEEDDSDYNPEMDESKGSWMVKSFARFDRKYLLPIFTHKGEWPEPVKRHARWLVNFCGRCAPGRSGKFEILEEDDNDEGSMSLDDNLEDEGKLVFDTELEPEDSGDIGLGTMSDDVQAREFEEQLGNIPTIVSAPEEKLTSEDVTEMA